MKFKRIFLLPVFLGLTLTGCGKGKKVVKCNIIFHQDEGDQNDVFEYNSGVSTYMDVKQFQDNIELNKRRGYDTSWEEFDLSQIASDYTVNALYTLHKYTITYMFETRVIGTASYTIESTEVEEPTLPVTPGYSYKYEEYDFKGKAEDFTVRATREMVTYYATFVDINGDQIGELVPFNISSESIVEPAVPEIVGKDGVWEDYSLDAGNITIHPIYTPHYYYASFWTSNDENKQLVGKVPFTIDDTYINEPAVPINNEYRDGYWQDYELGLEDIDIYPIYTNYHVFTAFYKQSSVDKNPVKVNFTYETRNQKVLDNDFGYTTFWKLDNVEYEGNTDIEYPMHDVTFIKSRREGHHHMITLNPNGGELTGGNTVEVVFGSEYEIETPTYYSAYNGLVGWYTEEGRVLPQTGKWEIDEDVSLTARYGLSFEGDSVPEFITIKQNVSSLSISNEAATFGEKSLKITVGTDLEWCDYGVIFSKQYLDDTFSNPDIVAITFDAIGCKHTSNFRARINNYNTTYEQNNDNYGLDTQWKKFSFRRAYYEAYVDGDAMIYGRYQNGDYLYIDNVVPVTEELTSFGFENGYLDETNKIYKSAGHSNSDPAPEQIFKILPGSTTISNLGFDYNDKSEGNRSLVFDKSGGYIALYLSEAIKNSLGDNGFVQFDFKTSIAYNSNPSVKNITDGMNNPLGGAGYQIPKDVWMTITFTNSQLTNDGRFFIIQGSPAPTLHFDNIRVVHAD